MSYDWSNHFSWVFSTFAQSLAAIIGVIGVFAVFRLQIQYTIVRESFEKLREVLLTKDTRGNQILVSGFTFEQILKQKVDFHNYLAHERSIYQNKLDQANAYIEKARENPSMTIFFHNQEKDEYLKKISEIDSVMGRSISHFQKVAHL